MRFGFGRPRMRMHSCESRSKSRLVPLTWTSSSCSDCRGLLLSVSFSAGGLSVKPHIAAASRTSPCFGVVLDSHGIAVAVGKNKCDGLICSRNAVGAIEVHPARLHMDDLRLVLGSFAARSASAALCKSIWTSPLQMMPPLLLLYWQLCVCMMSWRSPVLPKIVIFHVFEQAGVLVFEIGGFRGFDGKDLAVAIHFGEGESVRLPFDVIRCGRRRFLPLNDAVTSRALQIHAGRQTGQQQRDRRGPARVSRGFASSHGFS